MESNQTEHDTTDESGPPCKEVVMTYFKVFCIMGPRGSEEKNYK